jgi:S-adenosylmethionine/arginine decarboxylase-like enzyme
MKKDRYGIELVLDMHKCDISTFTKEHLARYFVEICELIEMKRHGEPVFWYDDSDKPHLRGISAMQFVETSNIVVHALEILETVFVNIFSCKDFNAKEAEEFTKRFFRAHEVNARVLERK